MAFTAARILVPRLNFAIGCLHLKGAPKEYSQSCETVLEAALSFRLLEGENGSIVWSDLDTCQARLSSRSNYCGDRSLFMNLLIEAQQHWYALLRNIQGYLSVLLHLRLKDIEFCSPSSAIDIPTLQHWYSLHMPFRSERIQDLVLACERAKKVIHDVREWAKTLDFSGLSSHQMGTLQLRAEQLDLVVPVRKVRVKIESLTIIGLERGSLLSNTCATLPKRSLTIFEQDHSKQLQKFLSEPILSFRIYNLRERNQSRPNGIRTLTSISLKKLH